jgi:cellobiose phosphorylase
MSLETAYEFIDEARAIRINDPRLPGPWINYLSNGNFHALVSHAGGGFAWWRSPLTYRLTRYRHHHQPIDSPGFYIYIREEDGSVWSPAFRPCERTDTDPVALHQPGFSEFTAAWKGLSATLKLFVLPDHDVLAWDLTLENESGDSRNLEVFAYAELSQHQWMEENRFGYYIRNMVKGWFDKETQTLKFLYHEPNQPRPEVSPMVTFAGTSPVISYSLHRDHFIGNYHSERLPRGVMESDCEDQGMPCGEGCFALHHREKVASGESHRMAWYLGVQPEALLKFEEVEERHARLVPRLRNFAYLDDQAGKVRDWWSNHLSVMQADIPDAKARRSINIWTPLNTVNTGRYSRAVNALAPGIRAMGYRDTAQDMLAVGYRKPDWAISCLKDLLAHQFEDGHALHLYSLEGDIAPSDSLHSDNHLWPPLLAYALVSETGRTDFLEEVVPYVSRDGKSKTGKATLWEHLLQGIRFTENNLGAHKLPLTFKGDWNDIIGKFSTAGKGESVFAGQQYCVALDQLMAVARFTGKESDEEWLADCRSRMNEALLEHAWDGKWWARGFDDMGESVGSDSRPFGKIFLNPQSWAVLAGVGNRDQHISGMDAAARYLDTGCGLKAMAPGFKTFPEDTDPFSGYGPGCAENGSVFCHANTWAVIAECLLGRPEKAWKYYSQLLPENLIEKFGIDRYEAEPYAWMSMVTGPENERFGWANTIHISGTAAWMDVAATQYILGIRPEPEGLRIDPRIPAEWPEYSVQRAYNGAELRIKVENPDGKGQSLRSAAVNGRPVGLKGDSLLIPRGEIRPGQSYRITISL